MHLLIVLNLLVAIPKTENNIIVTGSAQNKISITKNCWYITSWTNGDESAIDVSKHFTKIISFDATK
jgi:uncharacterized secreted protein with C-terminal beta-propeller domain